MYDRAMIALGIIIVLGLVGFLLPLADKQPKTKILKQVQDDEDGTKIVYVDKSELRQRQVQDFLKEKEEITNDEYQKLTGVSDAQATRDLDKLEEQGIVEQIGATGFGVVYRRKK